jgi:hypothetical protein
VRPESSHRRHQRSTRLFPGHMTFKCFSFRDHRSLCQIWLSPPCHASLSTHSGLYEPR